MPPPMPPRPPRLSDGIAKPRSLREVPAYICKKVKGFTTRLLYIVKLVWQSAPIMLIAMALLCLIDGILPVIGAYISKDLLNEISFLIESRSSDSLVNDAYEALSPLIFLFIMNILYLFLRRALGRVNTVVTGISGELVVNHIKLMIINKSKEVDLSSFDRPEFYEKLENANREAGMRPISILTATFNVISALISSVSFVVVLATLSPYAPLVIIAAALPGAIVNYLYRNRNFRYIRFHSKERREMNYYSGLMVNKDRAKEIKILGLGDTFIDKYKKVFKKYFKGLKSLMVKEGVTQIIVSLISGIANGAILIYVAYNVIYKDGLIGDYSLYSGALTSIAGYVTTLLTATATIYEGTLFIDNMITFMKEDVNVVPIADKPLLPEHGARHKIEFRNVSFAYPGTERFVLKNVNLVMEGSDSVVLVGLNGAGKTTLIKLLTRLYDPTEGSIYLDGHDLREYDVGALHSLFGIIFQDFGQYSDTVSENIRYGDIQSDGVYADVQEAAELGGAASFINELPLKYDTPLTRVFEDDGIELSGGQWQKLAISRAFYKDSDILILDEPTASLDPMAEQEVYTKFDGLAKDKITLFVSHRLSSAVTASKIVVIDGGTVAELGNHAELMALRGKYYKLFTTQASRYTDNYGVEPASIDDL